MMIASPMINAEVSAPAILIAMTLGCESDEGDIAVVDDQRDDRERPAERFTIIHQFYVIRIALDPLHCCAVHLLSSE